MTKRHSSALLLTLTVTFAAALAHAQDGTAAAPPPAPSPTPVASPTPSPTPAPASAPKIDSKPVLTGYAQIDYRRGDAKSSATAAEHELNVRRIRLTHAGKITKSVSYTATVQGDGANANTASVCDLYADLALAPWITVRAGQYKYEFDLEGRESDAANPMIDRAFATNAVGGGMNGASTASSPAGSHRDRGVSLLGSKKRGGVKWGYALGLFQGAGRASDNNSAFGFTGNGNVEPVAGLKLSAGVMSTRTENRGAAAESAYRAWTTGAAFDRGRVFLRGEYYRGTRQQAADQKVWGYYVLAAYTVATRVDILARYQFVEDEQLGTADNGADSADVSAKLYFDRRARRSGTHLSVTYMLRDADAAFKKGLTLLNDGRGATLEGGAFVGNVLAVRLQLVF